MTQLPHLRLTKVYPVAPHPPDMVKVAQELKGHEGFNLELDASDVFTIVSQLQLALRHPGNTGPSVEVVLSFIHAVIETGFAHCPEVQNLLHMGLESLFDLTHGELDDLYPPEHKPCENPHTIATTSAPATPTTSSMTSESSTVTIWSVSTPKPNIT